MTARRKVGTGLAMILLIACWQGIGSGVSPEGALIVSSATPKFPTALLPQGAGSCSATACHGSIIPASRGDYPSAVLRNEYTTWMTRDPHANAYQVLFSRRSQSIASRLSGGRLPAHKDARCVACHATTGPDPLAASTEVVRQDGVSCESCHGPSEKWLGAHTQTWWNRLTALDKETQFGMRATKELGHRASVCVDCHVGAPARDGLPARDVNHDLIAAGHPRLNFEFGAYLANMPPHWVEDTRGNFPARAWAVGQIATARASLELLHDRSLHAKDHNDGQVGSAPWPEFSEYDCYSCHHGLADEAWRKARADPNLPPGTLPWGTWYYPSALALAEGDPRANSADLKSRFRSLRAEMGRTSPDPLKVAGESQLLTKELAQWLQDLPGETKSYDARKVKSLIQIFETKVGPGAVSGWDQAAQRYLALQPLRLSLKDLDPTWADAKLKAELEDLFGRLQFPRGYDSPLRFEPQVRLGDH